MHAKIWILITHTRMCNNIIYIYLMITRMHMHTHIYTRTYTRICIQTDKKTRKASIITNDKRIHKAQYALFHSEMGVESLLMQKMNNYTPKDKIKP